MKHINRKPPPKQNSPAQPARHSDGIYCAYCGAQIPKNHTSCLICHTERGQSPQHKAPDDILRWGESVGTAHGLYQGRRYVTIIAIIMLFVFVISGTGVAAFQYFGHQYTVAQYAANNSALYRVDNTLKINIPALPQPITISEEFASGAGLAAQTSHDRRFIAYLENREPIDSRAGTLMLLDLIRLDNNSPHMREDIAVMTDVVDYRFLPRSDRIFLLTKLGDLYLCNYSSMKNLVQMGERVQMQQLDSDVRGIGDINGNHLLYYKGERATTTTWGDNLEAENGTPFDLFIVNFNAENIAPALIAEGVYRVEDSMRDFERIVYTRRTRSAPLTLYDVFVFHRKDGQSTRLVQDARHVVDASANRSAIFYLSPSEETLGFKDFFDDDMVNSDQLLTEPLLADYDLDSPEELDALDPAIVDERYNRYDIAFQRYVRKLDRDQLRREFRSELRDFLQNDYLSFRLYHANAISTTLLDENIYNHDGDITALVNGDVEAGHLLYSRGERETLQSVRMSELFEDDISELLLGDFDLRQQLSDNMLEGLIYRNVSASTALVNTEEIEIFLESGTRNLDRYFLTNDGKGLYFSSMGSHGSQLGTLYYSSLLPGEIGQVVHLDEDVTDYIGTGAASGSGLFYRKLSRGSGAMLDICVANAGTTSVLAASTLPDTDAMLLGEGNDVLTYYRVSENNAQNQLYLYSGQERFIGGAVTDLALYNPDTIYLRRGLGAQQELFLYHLGEMKLIDEKITDTAFLALPE